MSKRVADYTAPVEHFSSLTPKALGNLFCQRLGEQWWEGGRSSSLPFEVEIERPALQSEKQEFCIDCRHFKPKAAVNQSQRFLHRYVSFILKARNWSFLLHSSHFLCDFCFSSLKKELKEKL